MSLIYLIGFMGSGKSSVGKNLAYVLGTDFIDTDEFIERKYNRNIPNIFKVEGEVKFRGYETSALNEISKKMSTDDVISTGGGIVETNENYETMNQSGDIIYLQTSLDEIYKRLIKDTNRPLWNNNDRAREALYNRRIAMYEEWSNYTVDTDGKTISEIIQEIEHIINK